MQDRSVQPAVRGRSVVAVIGGVLLGDLLVGALLLWGTSGALAAVGASTRAAGR
jgi:hypothetical protein